MKQASSASPETGQLRAYGAAATDRAFLVLLWGVFVLTFFKGFRWPSLWCATHFTFNYSQGFVRRGLVGEIARQLFGPDIYHYNPFVGFSFFVQWTVGLLFVLSVRKVLRLSGGDWNLRVALLVLCSSPGMIFLVSAVGYFDFIGLLALLVLLFWARATRRSLPLLVGLVLGGALLALIHEGMIVMFGASALFIAVCHAKLHLSGRLDAKRKAWLFALGLGVALVAVAVIVVFASTPADPGRVRALHRFIAPHVDFALRGDAFDVFTRTTSENMFQAVPYFWSDQVSRERALRGDFGFLPSIAFLIWHGVRELRAAEPNAKLLPSLFVAASIAPEVMNLVAWDWPRWNAMALATSGLCIAAMRLLMPAARRAKPSLRLVTAGLLFTAIGLASTTMLFDRFEVQFFPFEHQFQFLQQLLHGNFKWRPLT